ncbi:retrovirus-related pol polyprotein from transposon TNT 1-94, partial [Tanacetum coccineum]
KLKGKIVIDTVVSIPHATTIAPGMFKLDLEPLAPKVLKNNDAHLDYIKHSREHANTLWEIFKSARALSPLDSNLDSACKYVQRIQEVLVFVRDTCPCLTRPSEKLVVVTQKNKDKKVRFNEPITSSRNTQKQVDSHKQKDSNQPLLHSIGVIGSTGISGSKPTCNTKNNRISQSSSSNKTNKVEDQSRSVKSRKNKKNRVAKTECNDYVMQSKLNVNSKSVCAICNEFLFDANHDKGVLDYVHNVVQIVLWYLDYGCSKHMTRNRSQLTNFVNKFLGIVKFGNDQIAKIMGYGDYQIRNVTISNVYYAEGLGHNLFSVGQFCDSDLEVAFRKHTCFVRNLEGVDLLTGSQDTSFYTLSIGDIMKSSLICLLSNTSKTKYWLWHRCLSHLNFGTTNQLAKQGLVRVIVDDYSWYTWVKFLRSKDEALEFIIKFLKMIQVRLNANVRNIRTDNGIEFVNQTLHSYYEDVGISYEKSVARTPRQNAVATTCYIQNHSLIRLRHGKTPYELLHDRKPDLLYLHVFGALCYLTNDSEDLGKLKAKSDVGILFGYAPAKKAYRIYNRRTRRIMETIHVDFDELTAMASKQSSSGPALNEMTPGTLSLGLMPQPPLQHLLSHQQEMIGIHCFNCTSSSTSVDQDAPSPSTSQTPQATSSHVIPLSAKEAVHDIEVTHMDNNPQFVVRLEAIHIFLAFAAHMNMVVYQMDVKNAFLNDILGKEVYVSHLDGFVNPENPNYVYKLKKALYGLKREGKDILLISQSPRGIFLNQSKYALEIIKKYGMETSDLVDTPMVEKSKLDADPHRKEVDPTCYRRMIGSLIYLTAIRPDLLFVVCMCAQYQAKPIEKHLHAVKQIFRYLKGTDAVVVRLQQEVLQLPRQST